MSPYWSLLAPETRGVPDGVSWIIPAYLKSAQSRFCSLVSIEQTSLGILQMISPVDVIIILFLCISA